MTVDEFIAEWWGKPGGAERSNFAPFVFGLCQLLNERVPGQSEQGKLGEYEFEGSVPKGSFRSLEARGAIDLYKRGHFIMEAKQTYIKPEQGGLDLGEPQGPRAPSGARYDKLMRDARLQAENYAKNLPASEPVAPFLIVCDIGRAFEIYHDAAGNGRGYQFFPDKQNYRIELTDLRDPVMLDRLKAIWSNPRSIDPRFQSAEVTRLVAGRLASVSQYIEDGLKGRLAGKNAREKSEEIEEAALFLMRILFCMFAEDIGLLPADKFKDFLLRSESDDKIFANGLEDLWHKMGHPTDNRYAHALFEDVAYFNGGLFESNRTYPLGGFVIHDLYEAARQNWRKVEPAIFGTLLEQALTPEERSKLGAHYTPRTYVETLVRATIMDVLEPEWAAVEEAIALLVSPPLQGGDQGVGASASERTEPQRAASPPPTPDPSLGREGRSDAVALAVGFHDRLASIRVLDPACGTGNFLYVSMELMQALESRVIETIQMLGGETSPKVGPHQFHGLEKNPRAAKIAELVLWIGWLRNRLHDDPDSVPQPVLAESASINFGRHGGYDAVLQMDATGQPDLANPMVPDWPEAEFIVGNPPFIGGKDLRDRLGSEYAEALWVANPRVPKSADFVMQWWDRAAHTLVANDSPLIRFGFVTTNSITQDFSRRVISNYLGDNEDRLSLVMAIPDHPWTKSVKDAAAVRIAMTVAEKGAVVGELRELTSEAHLDTDEPQIALVPIEGEINADLTAGTDAGSANPLVANGGIASRGVQLMGAGFIIPAGTARDLGLGPRTGLENHIRPYCNGRDLLQKPRGAMVIDLYGLDEIQVRQNYPEVWQHLDRTVRLTRREQVEKSPTVDAHAYLKNWWLFGKPRPVMRAFLNRLPRYIVTVETSKHRIFQFLDAQILPDNMIVAIGSDDAFHLGVLQSRVHTEWALRVGGTLEDRPRYNKSKVFDPFPFPDPTPEQRSAIAELAEELDTTRKMAIAETDKLTMTELYNLRAKLHSGVPMDDKDQRRATRARAAIVDRLHEQLDQAVADAYGWGELWAAGALGPSEIVARLVKLNAERAAEEAAGQVRWLRPDYQIPRFGMKKNKQVDPGSGPG